MNPVPGNQSQRYARGLRKPEEGLVHRGGGQTLGRTPDHLRATPREASRAYLESNSGPVGVVPLLKLQSVVGNQVVSRLVGKATSRPTALSSLLAPIQRNIDRAIFEEHLKRSRPMSMTLDKFLVSRHWKLLEEAIGRHNQQQSALSLHMITTAVEAIDDVVISDFIDAFSNLLDQVGEETGRLFLKGRRAAIPSGVNDATEIKTSMTNCAAIVAGVMTGRTSGAVSGNRNVEISSDFFSDFYLKSTGKEPSDPFKGRGISKDQIRGVELWIATELKRAGIEISSIEQRGHATPDDLSLADAKAQMASYPRGTQFAVGLTILSSNGPRHAHWVYADNYDGKVMFFDYQRDRLHPLVLARETASYKSTMSKLSEREKSSKEDFGLRSIIEQTGSQPTMDLTSKKPSGPKVSETPVIYDYTKDVIDPPALNPTGVLFLAFRPALSDVERIKRKLSPELV